MWSLICIVVGVLLLIIMPWLELSATVWWIGFSLIGLGIWLGWGAIVAAVMWFLGLIPMLLCILAVGGVSWFIIRWHQNQLKEVCRKEDEQLVKVRHLLDDEKHRTIKARQAEIRRRKRERAKARRVKAKQERALYQEKVRDVVDNQIVAEIKDPNSFASKLLQQNGYFDLSKSSAWRIDICNPKHVLHKTFKSYGYFNFE